MEDTDTYLCSRFAIKYVRLVLVSGEACFRIGWSLGQTKHRDHKEWDFPTIGLVVTGGNLCCRWLKTMKEEGVLEGSKRGGKAVIWRRIGTWMVRSWISCKWEILNSQSKSLLWITPSIRISHLENYNRTTYLKSAVQGGNTECKQ